MHSSPQFHLRLFGSPTIASGGGAPLTGRVAQRHRLALLALLALAPGQRASRDKLMALLWPESDPERGRNLLKVSSYVARSALGDGALLSEGDDLRLSTDVVRADALDFEEALAAGRYAHAVELYGGPFLDGFFLPDAPEFEQWASRERERLAASYGKALESLACEAEAGGEWSAAAEWWKKRAAQDPYDSRVAVRLMQALEASGNRAGALQLATVHQRLLEQEFATAAPEVAALAERLRREPVVAPAVAAMQGDPTSVQEDALPTAGARAATQEPIVQPSDSPAVSPAAVAAPAPRLTMRGRRRLGIVAALATVIAIATLWRAWPASALPERSIAVLPFVDLTQDGGSELFSDGLTEEILTGLAGIAELKVISRTSAMHYKGTTKTLRDIARELNVAHILEGSVRQSGGRVRISAQLIDARNDEHLWAQNFDSELGDVLGVQEQIARQVVRALEIELGERGSAALVTRGTSDTAAYELYRRARYLWQTRTKEGHERAVEYYESAIARDSSYADAYAGLADAYMTAYQLWLAGPEAEVYTRAKWAAERALALDDGSADAHVSFAVSLQWQRNWSGAEREFRRAIELNPSHATARTWYSLLLAGLGRTEEAIEESRKAAELDPFAVVASSNYGWQCYLARDYDCAIAQYRRTLEIATDSSRTLDRLGLAFAQQGRLDESIAALTRAISLDARRTDFPADLAYVLALSGDTARALELVDRARAQVFEPFSIARAYVGLGQVDSAFAWLDRSRWQWPHRAVLSDPGLDPLRRDPRFTELQARIEREMGMRR